MISEKHIQGFDNILQAIQEINKEGFIIEFVTHKNGFINPENNITYLPSNIIAVELIRLYAELSDTDGDSILYLLETDDGLKGWISDSYSIYADTVLAEHINSIKKHISHTKNEL